MPEIGKWLLAVILLILGLLFLSQNLVIKPMQNVVNVVEDVSLKNNQENMKMMEKINKDAWNMAKTKIYVPKKDIKTCMKIWNVKEINNKVIECTRDHYVEMRNDEVENFKKENEL